MLEFNFETGIFPTQHSHSFNTLKDLKKKIKIKKFELITNWFRNKCNKICNRTTEGEEYNVNSTIQSIER